ncbi:amidohydrolase [Sediminibacterium sp.]|uniref:amidohydrolase n=1 Tax=Sediminibacterium sp. TaxID=1917865 RepID=UPI003F6FFE12
MKKIIAFLLLLSGSAEAQPSQATLEQLFKEENTKIINWRRYFHEFPELGNREFNTCKKVEETLKSFGISTRIVAKTGVVGILKGGKPGPVVALRADMDGLPVEERNGLSFASKAKGEYNGATVPVMHACGHDSHVAMLLGAAEVLSKIKNDINGTVVFLFQPAEEGPPGTEEGGAPLMIKEGAMDNPKVDAVFGIHINSKYDLGKIYYKPGATMASSDWFTIKVKGKQSHGAYPWNAIDPIVVSAEIVQALQTIVSRNIDITQAPVVVSVGRIQSGVRANIIPEEAMMEGTIRTLDSEVQKKVHEKIRLIAENIAEANGTTAEVIIDTKTLVTFSDPELVERSLPSLQAAAGGASNVKLTNWVTGAEDFSFFGTKAPSFFFFLGARDTQFPTMSSAPDHHTPGFIINDSKLDVGMKAFVHLVLDFAKTGKK